MTGAVCAGEVVAMVCIPRHVPADGERGLGVQPRPQVGEQAIVILRAREVRAGSLGPDTAIDSNPVVTADFPVERVLAGIGGLRRLEPGNFRGLAAKGPAHISECLQSECKLKRPSCR